MNNNPSSSPALPLTSLQRALFEFKSLGEHDREKNYPTTPSNYEKYEYYDTQEYENREEILIRKSMEEIQTRKNMEDIAMRSTNVGKSFLFVSEVISRHQKLLKTIEYAGYISTVSTDDMVHLAENILNCQSSFFRDFIDTTVTIGYHYTNSTNIDSIKRGGLMTHYDRSKNNINALHHGSVFGDGIYTSTNPFAFHSYRGGDVGLLCAVLIGRIERVKNHRHDTSHTTTTIIGNKKIENFDSQNLNDIPLRTTFYDEIVLKRSCQCIPLIQFKPDIITNDDNSPGNEIIWSYHQEMQNTIDKFFNDGRKTCLRRILPSEGGLFCPLVGWASKATVGFGAPKASFTFNAAAGGQFGLATSASTSKFTLASAARIPSAGTSGLTTTSGNKPIYTNAGFTLPYSTGTAAGSGQLGSVPTLAAAAATNRPIFTCGTSTVVPPSGTSALPPTTVGFVPQFTTNRSSCYTPTAIVTNPKPPVAFCGGNATLHPAPTTRKPHP